MKRTMTPHDRILQAAKEMRRTATPAEKALWAELRDRRLAGLKFYRQDVIGSFIADFYCVAYHRQHLFRYQTSRVTPLPQN
jgi:very-short-patch-repair endonuclease